MRHQNRDGDASSPKDFINENKSIMFQWNQYREARKYQVLNESQTQSIVALQRKVKLEEEKRNKNLFQLYKWDIVR